MEIFEYDTFSAFRRAVASEYDPDKSHIQETATGFKAPAAYVIECPIPSMFSASHPDVHDPDADYDPAEVPAYYDNTRVKNTVRLRQMKADAVQHAHLGEWVDAANPIPGLSDAVQDALIEADNPDSMEEPLTTVYVVTGSKKFYEHLWGHVYGNSTNLSLALPPRSLSRVEWVSDEDDIEDTVSELYDEYVGLDNCVAADSDSVPDNVSNIVYRPESVN